MADALLIIRSIFTDFSPGAILSGLGMGGTELLGACLLPVVVDIESGLPPAELVERHRLGMLAEWFRACGMEALVLGCTHFPYFQTALAERTSLPLINPAEEMVRLLTAPTS